jgi:hypothetical protein
MGGRAGEFTEKKRTQSPEYNTEKYVRRRDAIDV